MQKSNIMKLWILFTGMLLATSVGFAAAQVLNVTMQENVNEVVTFNPLQSTSGVFTDANEARVSYTINGTINVHNIHSTESMHDVVLNISPIANIINITNLTTGGYVSTFNTGLNYMVLYIPDIAPGQNVTFFYNVNSSNVAPPLNFTTNYSDSRLLAGLQLGVTDTISNNVPLTAPSTCLYDINISQVAHTILGSNVSYVPASVGGADSPNANIVSLNRNLTWTPAGGGCYNPGNTTFINYDVQIPSNITGGGTFNIINTTISYALNATFSGAQLQDIVALTDLDLRFDKQLNQTLNLDNGTWRVRSFVDYGLPIDVNLTQVTLWVSQRNATGTGFTNPSVLDNDTVSFAALTQTYTPNVLLNSTQSRWNNSPFWYFNYTVSSSPIVWMDLQHNVINDGFQLINRSLSFGSNSYYVKELYIVTGYWLEITKNVTRLSQDNYAVTITVINLGSQPTPTGQVVNVYNFLPNTFTLTSGFVYGSGDGVWYNTSVTNTTLIDAVYNGSMFQFALIPNGNPSTSSLDLYGGAPNQNNTWTVTFNVSGSGEFDFDDLFLTGVDPLHVEKVGGTKAVIVEALFDSFGNKIEYVLAVAAGVASALILFV